MAVSRVAVIKIAIVAAAAVSTAVLVFVTSYLTFGFDLVSRGRPLDYFPAGWATVFWMASVSLVAALLVRRWWLKQAQTGNLSSILWLAGYLATTLAVLFFYFLTFTALFKP